MRIVVISPLGPLPWVSMREITPAAERSWKKLCQRGHTVDLIRIKKPGDLFKHISRLVKADRIVFTKAYDLDFQGSIRFLRQYLSLSCPFLIHLYAEAASGMIDFEPIRDLFIEKDTFIVTCKAERNSIRLCFPRARIRIAPCALGTDHTLKAGKKSKKKHGSTLIYAGRISPQKNLHLLLWSVRILKDHYPELPFRLFLIGPEDQRGSPNMGMGNRDYGRFLKKQVRQLQIQNEVRWVGNISPKALRNGWLSEKHVFVSASLGADEAFGVAAFHALWAGNPAVLSAWGNHLDFSRHFKRQVKAVKVRESARGPFISPFDFARKIAQTLRDPLAPKIRPVEYQIDSVASRLEGFLSVGGKCSALVKQSRLREKIVLRKQKRRFQGRHVFDGYDDPWAQPFFRAYGMRGHPSRLTPRAPSLAPWLRLRGNRITVSDPHRGNWIIVKQDETKRISALHQAGYAF